MAITLLLFPIAVAIGSWIGICDHFSIFHDVMPAVFLCTHVCWPIHQGRHLRGLGAAPPRRKKKEKQKEKKKKEEKRKKEGNYMYNVKLLYIKCCFFQFFNSPVALKNKNKFGPHKKKLKWRKTLQYTIVEKHVRSAIGQNCWYRTVHIVLFIISVPQTKNYR